MSPSGTWVVPLKAICSMKWARPRSLSLSPIEPNSKRRRTDAVPLGVALCMMAYFMPLGSVPYLIDGSGVTSVSLTPQPFAAGFAAGAVAASAGALPAMIAMAMAALLTRERNGLTITKNTPPDPLIRRSEPRGRARECKPTFLQTADFIGQTVYFEKEIDEDQARSAVRADPRSSWCQCDRSFFAGRAQGAEYSIRLSTAKLLPMAALKRFSPRPIAAFSSDRLAW